MEACGVEEPADREHCCRIGFLGKNGGRFLRNTYNRDSPHRRRDWASCLRGGIASGLLGFPRPQRWAATLVGRHLHEREPVVVGQAVARPRKVGRVPRAAGPRREAGDELCRRGGTGNEHRLREPRLERPRLRRGGRSPDRDLRIAVVPRQGARLRRAPAAPPAPGGSSATHKAATLLLEKGVRLCPLPLTVIADGGTAL